MRLHDHCATVTVLLSLQLVCSSKSSKSMMHAACAQTQLTLYAVPFVLSDPLVLELHLDCCMLLR